MPAPPRDCGLKLANCGDVQKGGQGRATTIGQEPSLEQIYERIAGQERRMELLATQQIEQLASQHNAICEKLADMSNLLEDKSMDVTKPLFIPAHEATDLSLAEIKHTDIATLRAKSKAHVKTSVDLCRSESKLLVGFEEERRGRVDRFRHFLVSWRAEALLGIVILLNMCVMFAHFQWAGYSVEHSLGLRNDDANWHQADAAFEIIEKCFNAFYFAEMLARMTLLCRSHYSDPLNIIDSGVVLICVFEDFILKPLNILQLPQLIYLRAVRTIRIFRSVKILKLMNNFDKLRILLKILASTIDDLMWGLLLLALIILASGMLLVTFVQPFIEDEGADFSRRVWAFEHFGSSFRASYTLFEATFTGSWTASARPLILEVNELFAIFWICFVCVVNFALCRVVGALFLKETMAVATADAESNAKEVMKSKNKFADKLRRIFALADVSGDGCISSQEFQDMLNNPEVVAHFQELDLPLDDVSTLFLILSEEDDSADYNEFLAGAMQMKRSAQNLDAITIVHGIDGVSKRVDQINETLQMLLRRHI